MNCKTCGSEITPGTLFCGVCGSLVEYDPSSDEAAKSSIPGFSDSMAGDTRMTGDPDLDAELSQFLADPVPDADESTGGMPGSAMPGVQTISSADTGADDILSQFAVNENDISGGEKGLFDQIAEENKEADQDPEEEMKEIEAADDILSQFAVNENAFSSESAFPESQAQPEAAADTTADDTDDILSQFAVNDIPQEEPAFAAEEAVEEAAAPVEEAVTEAAAPVEEAVAEAAAPVEEAVTEAAAPVEEAVTEAAAPVEETVTEAAAPVEEAVTEAAASVEEAVAETAAPVEEAVTEAAAPMEEAVTEAAAPAEKPVETPVQQPTQPVQPSIPGVVQPSQLHGVTLPSRTPVSPAPQPAPQAPAQAAPQTGQIPSPATAQAAPQAGQIPSPTAPAGQAAPQAGQIPSPTAPAGQIPPQAAGQPAPQGAAQGYSVIPEEDGNSKKKQANQKILIIALIAGIVIFVLAIILLVVFVILPRLTGKNEEEEYVVSETAVTQYDATTETEQTVVTDAYVAETQTESYTTAVAEDDMSIFRSTGDGSSYDNSYGFEAGTDAYSADNGFGYDANSGQGSGGGFIGDSSGDQGSNTVSDSDIENMIISGVTTEFNFNSIEFDSISNTYVVTIVDASLKQAIDTSNASAWQSAADKYVANNKKTFFKVASTGNEMNLSYNVCTEAGGTPVLIVENGEIFYSTM